MWPACGFLLVVFYLASFGPVTWLAVNDGISQNTYNFLADTLYLPLSWLNGNTDFFDEDPIGRAYMKYVLWFGP